MSTLGRNAPCPCGSGKKYKHCCEKAVETPLPAPSPAEFNQLVALFNAGRPAELESRVRALLAQFPDSGFAWKLLAVSLQVQRKEALSAFQKAAELLPADAEAHFNLGVTLKSLGQLDSAVASYRRALQLKPDYAEAHGNLGNALKDLGRLDEAVASYRSALKIQPGSAEAHNNLGNALKDLGRLDEAVTSYRNALEIRPNYADAHYNLGNALRSIGRFDEAAASYRCALEIKPDSADTHNNLGCALKDGGRLDEAATSYRRALEINPNHADAHNGLGGALQGLGQRAAAEACFRRAIEIAPGLAEAHNNLGFELLLTGRFAEGWKEYWWRVSPRERRNHPLRSLSGREPSFPAPDERLPPSLQGLRITILKDQGLGDELFFIRFARELRNRGAWVAYVADPRIAPFIRRAKWVDSVTEMGEGEGSQLVLLAGDLPLALGMAGADGIPPPVPLEALPEKRREIALRLAPHRKAAHPLIGITWRGGADKQLRKNALFKEIAPEQLAVGLREKRATYIVVQRNPQPGEIAAFESALGQPVLDFSDLNDDLEGMLALMELLDDYIGVSNTNMHLRASAGRAARVLVPHLQDFRWMAEGGGSPWFPGFTVYRRTPENNWDGALEQLKCHIL